MFSVDDTIVAIATPPGRGALGVIRIGGPRAQAIAAALITTPAPLQPRRATFTRVRGHGTRTPDRHLDTVIVTLFSAPNSYTGEDIVEISAHGSPVVLRQIVDAALRAGARLAEPGEFTLRAYIRGKLDLVQAEAVGDLIEAATPLQARAAFDQLDGTLTQRIAQIDAALFDTIARLEASLDFPDEGYHFIQPAEIARHLDDVIGRMDVLLGDATRGRLIREGATVVIAGRPNVGKSSIFNALAGTDRAIVTAVAGTTRDLVTETLDVDGLAVTLVDTAGAHDTSDVVEREGVARGSRARAVADLVLVVVDSGEPLTPDDRKLLAETAAGPRLVLSNKVDLGPPLDGAIPISATTGTGLDQLRTALREALTGSEGLRDSAALTNVRHIALLREARMLLQHARDSAATGGVPEEFLLTDLQDARGRFDEIVGRRTSDDLLRHIFERFCIGK